MTGEVSLTGKVLPVGGIKEKTIAVSFFTLGYVLSLRWMEWVRRYRVVLSFYFHSFYYLIQSVILLLSKIYNLMNYLDV